MKRITQILSIFCLIIAVVSVILNFRVLFGRGYAIGFSITARLANGRFMGFIGNIIGLLITAISFAVMGWFGILLTFFNKESARKPAFISGLCVSVLALLSLFFSIGHGFNIGDLIILAFPVLFTFFVLQSTKT